MKDYIPADFQYSNPNYHNRKIANQECFTHPLYHQGGMCAQRDKKSIGKTDIDLDVYFKVQPWIDELSVPRESQAPSTEKPWYLVPPAPAAAAAPAVV